MICDGDKVWFGLRNEAVVHEMQAARLRHTNSVEFIYRNGPAYIELLMYRI